jgi:hypothetical protein
MGYDVELNHKSQTQKNYEARFSINQIMRVKLKKKINKRWSETKKIELKIMMTKIAIKRKWN